MSAGPILYRAAWVCPVSQPPIKNGCVLVVDDRIAAVETFSEALDVPGACRTIDLGNAAIIPGLINAHTHLEFSQLKQPLGQPGIKFTDWVRLIVGQRNDANKNDPQSKHDSIVKGIQESFQFGSMGRRRHRYGSCRRKCVLGRRTSNARSYDGVFRATGT